MAKYTFKAKLPKNNPKKSGRMAQKSINDSKRTKKMVVNKSVIKNVHGSKNKNLDKRIKIMDKPSGLIQINQHVVPYVINTPYYMLGNERVYSDIYIPSSLSSLSDLRDVQTCTATLQQVKLINDFLTKMPNSHDLKKSIDLWKKNHQLINIHQSMVHSKRPQFIKKIDLDVKNITQKKDYEALLNMEGGLLGYEDMFIQFASFDNKLLVINTQFNVLTANKFVVNNFIVNDDVKEFLKFLGALLMGQLGMEYKRSDKLIDIQPIINSSNSNFNVLVHYNKRFPKEWNVSLLENSSIKMNNSTGGPATSTCGTITPKDGPTTSTGGPTTSTGGPASSTGGPASSTGGPTTSTCGTITPTDGPTTSTGGQKTTKGAPTTSFQDASGTKRFKVLFQKDQLAYVVVQSVRRKEDEINYPIKNIKGLRLDTKKKTLFVNVEFDGDWSETERDLWCTHSNVAASELIQRYMDENDLKWEVDFKGYTKRPKKCFVDCEPSEISEDESELDEEVELEKKVEQYMKIIE